MARIENVEEYYCEYENCDKQVYLPDQTYCYTHTIKTCKHHLNEREFVSYSDGKFQLMKRYVCDKCDLYKTRTLDSIDIRVNEITPNKFQKIKNILKDGE